MFLDMSILNFNLDEIEKCLTPIRPWIPILHMDIMDGKFVKQTSFGTDIVRRSKNVCNLAIFDVHLMCVNPEELFMEYKDAGADYITFHYETGNVVENINKIHSMGLKAGLSINPDTDVKVLIPYLKDIDTVLIMSVFPGLGGQKFIESSIEKVKFLKEYKDKNNLHYLINIDGGINMETYKYVKPYCDLAVVGSAITRCENYIETYINYLKAFSM